MKTTDFSQCLVSYLTMFLPGQLGLSKNTVMAYRDTFKQLLWFAESEYGLPAEKITLSVFNVDFIVNFLDWIECKRGCSVATRNQRLATLRAFAKYARTQYPEFLFESQKIMDLKTKKVSPPAIVYLTAEEVQCILAQPDTSTKCGRRDMLILSLMYDSGARVQEICDLCVRDIRLQKPYTVKLTGKGQKTRFVPLMNNTVNAIKAYFSENNLYSSEKADYPLFQNHQHGKFTRAGIAYILKKYFDNAKKSNSNLPAKISPHIFRHSKAMHMLQAGVNLIYIRDFLGHAHVETTEIYAKADITMKRKAIEDAYIKIDNDLPNWSDNKDLMTLLTNLCGNS